MEVERSSKSEAEAYVGSNEPATTVVTGSNKIIIYEDGYSEKIYSPLDCSDRDRPSKSFLIVYDY